MAACPIAPPDAPVILSLVASVDCQTRDLAQTIYSGLLVSGGHLAGLLTIVLVLTVAWAGYGMMLGRLPWRLTQMTGLMVKIGIVLALTTRWPTYQRLVQNLLFDGPAWLASNLISGPGHQGRQVPFERLQSTLDLMRKIASAYAAPKVQEGITPVVITPDALVAASNMKVAADTLLMSTLGVLLAAKAALAILLGLGPLFILMLLFSATTGLFEGWLRAVTTLALIGLTIMLVLGLALALLEPRLAQLAQLVRLNEYPAAPAQAVVLLVTIAMGLAVLSVVGSATTAFGFRLPRPSAGWVDGFRSQAHAELVARGLFAAPVSSQGSAISTQQSETTVSQTSQDRRLTITPPALTTATLTPSERLGQAPRRPAQPRRLSSNARSS